METVTPTPDMASSRTLLRFSPEFRLVLACLRFPFTPARVSAIHAVAETVTAWDRVLAIAQRHRVVGLVSRGCTLAQVAIPAEVAAQLQSNAALQARQGMALAFESMRIDKVLRAAGLVPVFLKGSTVTALAYGDSGIRQAKDIDLLVPRAQVEAAMQTLRGCGYLPLPPAHALNAHQLRRWLQHGKSMDWQHTQSGILLELHWKMSDLPVLEPASGLEVQQVSIAGAASLATLRQDHLFAYLCMHGASHGWSRLKWLADIHALLARDSMAIRDAAYHRAVSLGAGIAARQALLLCHDLLQLPLGERTLRHLRADAVLTIACRAVARLYRRGDEVSEIYDLPFGTTSIYALQLLLADSPHALLVQMQARAFPVEEVVFSPLSDALLPLFPISRAATWFQRRLRNHGRSAPST